MIACDIDGTLLDYDHIPGQIPAINYPLIRQLRQRTDKLLLITNQGGLPFGVQGIVRNDGRKYPAPEDFIDRFVCLAGALALYGISIGGVWACTFHAKARPEAVEFAAETLDELLYTFPGLSVHIYPGAKMRKPSPAMLHYSMATCYYGDSDEDEQAATAAGIKFVRVGRFFRPVA